MQGVRIKRIIRQNNGVSLLKKKNIPSQIQVLQAKVYQETRIELDGMVVVILPDPFRGMGARRNSAETQQSGHNPRSGPKIKNGERGAKDRFTKGFRGRTVEEEMIEVL